MVTINEVQASVFRKEAKIERELSRVCRLEGCGSVWHLRCAEIFERKADELMDNNVSRIESSGK